jgi:hypothetical protein
LIQFVHEKQLMKEKKNWKNKKEEDVEQIEEFQLSED